MEENERTNQTNSDNQGGKKKLAEEGENAREMPGAASGNRSGPERRPGRRTAPDGKPGRRMTPEEVERRRTARAAAAKRKAREQAAGRQGASGQRKPVRSAAAKRKRKRILFLRSLAVCFVLAILAAGAFLWKRYSPSKERADLNEYYGIEQEGQIAIVMDNERIEDKGMVSDGQAYVRYETVKTYLNERFYWDGSENTLLYTLPESTVSAEVGSRDYSVGNEKSSKDYIIVKAEADITYIALDFIQEYTDMAYGLYEDPGRIVVKTQWGDAKVADVKKDTQIRYRGGIKSPIITEVSKGDEVTVLESEENWEKVCTQDGFIGYVRTRALTETQTKSFTHEFEEPQYTNISKDYTINLAWHNVTNQEANSAVLEKIAASKGLTTLAPTWYHVKDTDGNLASISSSDYVNYAHQSDIEVWATVRDFDGGIDSADDSYAVLSSTSKRENLINQLIADAVQTKIDGINVDFENISEECGDHYIQFIRELSVRCRQNGLVLSIDNYVPKGYNQQYNRKEQGIVADYVIIMGYDEHYGGSPEAGPVASYNFVKEGIEATKAEVPAEKIINGVPFFTRLWKETPKTAEEIASDQGTENEQYTMKVESQAYTMPKAKEVVAQAGAEITWDDEAKQNYATWQDGDSTYEIWLEDESSLEPRLQLMKENGLAGTAAWALGQESPEVWTLIQKYVN